MLVADVAEYYAEQGGGVKTYIDHKMRVGARLGHDVVIVAPGPANRVETRADGRIVWVKAPRLVLDPRYHIFTQQDGVHAALDALRPDVVEGSSAWRGAWAAANWDGDALKSWFIHQDPVAGYVHTLLDRWVTRDRLDASVGWFWRYFQRLSAGFDTTVVGAPWLSERFAALGMRRPHAIPVGVDSRWFDPAQRSAAVRAELLALCGIDDPAAPLLITISRHHPEKRLSTVLDGFAAASAARPMGLILIGDGPSRARVERQAARVPGAHVMGVVRDRTRLAQYLASADGLLHGSAAEICATAVAEAMAAGLPLIVPDFGGALGWAQPGYSEVYAAGSAEACAAAIARLLARPHGELSAAARAAALAQLTEPDAHFETLFDYYREQAAAKTRGALAA